MRAWAYISTAASWRSGRRPVPRPAPGVDGLFRGQHPGVAGQPRGRLSSGLMEVVRQRGPAESGPMPRHGALPGGQLFSATGEHAGLRFDVAVDHARARHQRGGGSGRVGQAVRHQRPGCRRHPSAATARLEVVPRRGDDRCGTTDLPPHRRRRSRTAGDQPRADDSGAAADRHRRPGSTIAAAPGNPRGRCDDSLPAFGLER